MFEDLLRWFWTDTFWLPYGFHWSDVKQCPLFYLYVCPFIAVLMLLVRHIFENYLAVFFCTWIGIPMDPNTHKERKVHGKPGRYVDAQKAKETCWRCFAYFVLFAYGAVVILRTDWFWNNESWLVGYIREQPFPTDLKVYYVLELSFYMSLLATHFRDTKRKDFLQQFVHHLLTIILLAGSYVIAHFRYGSVIMFLHDASDYWLESAKLAKYAKRQRLCDALFVVFALIFYATRWVYFPLCVALPWTRDNAKLSGPLQSYITFPYIFLYMCITLMLLHLYWGFLIGRMVYNFTRTGSVEKDDRSDGEDD